MAGKTSALIRWTSLGITVAALVGCQGMRSATHANRSPLARLGKTVVAADDSRPAAARTPLQVVSVEKRHAGPKLRMPWGARSQRAPSLAMLPQDGVITADATSLDAKLLDRMENVFLVSAQVADVAKPGELSLDFAASEEETAVPAEGGAIPALPGMETEVVEGGDSCVIYEPLVCGASPDACGLSDNFLGRIGATMYDSDLMSEWGVVGIGEFTKQWYDSNWFTHAGVATASIDGSTPVAYSVGFSRLASVRGCCVEKPWILGFSYDGFYTNDFLGTDGDLYVDQIRGLLGYAIKPCMDIGVWAAGGLSDDRVMIPTAQGTSRFYSAQFGNRVAGYLSWHLGQTGIQSITSVGWEDDPGGYFVQQDGWIPLTQACNFWVQSGYSDGLGGSATVSTGLEFILGRTWVARKIARHFGEEIPRTQMMAADTMGHQARYMTQIDPTCVRYRGGWANDSYRSALRVVTPTLALNMMGVEQTDGGGVPGVGIQIEPPIIDGEEPCPPSTNPLEVVVPRKMDRPVRESRLSQYQEVNGKRHQNP